MHAARPGKGAHHPPARHTRAFGPGSSATGSARLESAPRHWKRSTKPAGGGVVRPAVLLGHVPGAELLFEACSRRTRARSRPGWRPIRSPGGCRSSRDSSPTSRPGATSPPTRARRAYRRDASAADRVRACR